MEMNELFYKDAYVREFDAKVIECREYKKGYDVVLEDTAFYPEGGGQPFDLGTLDGIEVFDVQRDAQDVIHHYAKEALEVGKLVHGVIDWNRRFDFMQNHSGEHIVSGLIHKHFGYENVGFHMGEVIQIDISGPLDWNQLMMIEQEANEIIYQNIPVQITFPSNEKLDSIPYRLKKELQGKVRIVTIENADICACCETHVKNTGEIGLIKILSFMKHKNGIRFDLVCGKRALAYMRKEHDACKEVSCLLSAKPLEIHIATKKLLNNNLNLLNEKKQCMQKLLEMKLETYTQEKEYVIDFEEGLDRVSLMTYANALLEEKHIPTVCVFNKQEDGYMYIILSKKINLQEYVKQLNTELSGRGGGKKEVIQGSFQSDAETIENVLVKTLPF